MHAVSPVDSEENLSTSTFYNLKAPARGIDTAIFTHGVPDTGLHPGFSVSCGLRTPPGDHPGCDNGPRIAEASETFLRAKAEVKRGTTRNMGSTTYHHPSMYGRYDSSSTTSRARLVNGDYSQLPEAERKRAILSDNHASYLRVSPLSVMPIPMASKDLSPDQNSLSSMSSRTRSSDSDYAYTAFLSEARHTQSDMERQHARMARDAFGAAGSASSSSSRQSQTPSHQSHQLHQSHQSALQSAQQQVHTQRLSQTAQAQAEATAAARAVLDSMAPLVNASASAISHHTHLHNSDNDTNTNTNISMSSSQLQLSNTATNAEPPSSTPIQRLPIQVSDSESIVLVKHSLSIPRFISPEGGSLPDFVAEMTCLFWFESPQAYKNIDTIDQVPSDTWVPRLSPNAVPNASFKTWVNRMLTTTQVTQNVVLLALLFIYRLKTWNNFVHGKPGSEFRLLTVALMLGNKFLDDNTYTNRTWSDVSMLNVKEIHVMEVEFLSNMRYGLLVSKTEWDAWLVKLAKFRLFYKRASNAVLMAPNLSPARSLSSIMLSPGQQQQQQQQQQQRQGQTPSQNLSPTSVFSTATNASIPQLTAWAPQLPPTLPTLPARSAASSSAIYNMPDHLDINKSTTTTPSTYAAPSFSTPTKRMSPMNAALAAAAAASQSSPLSETFAQHMAAAAANGVHTPISHSPSIYLQQRPSPYRPIRHVHMLLNPPSSTSLQDYHQSATAGPPMLIPPPQIIT
ncbi:cyclin-related protein 2 [Ophiostoma piceae UAMH 11346]|uniref:Cyclin-related protein 2 n=1 Tax=Ophiostoma piceae (strain UAMH 11346) TaxID=1262450 RepID=S3C152_OPHP1|nr:cyclin-related protein 2 [Ophiostoma piceae UAMH 11346]